MLEDTIFVFGSGRSGTTLLAKLIDSSRSVLYRHEPEKNYPSKKIPFLPEPPQYGELWAETRKYLQALTQVRAASSNSKLPIFDKNFRTPMQTTLLRLTVSACVAASKFNLQIPVPDLVRSNEFRYLIKSVESHCRVPLFARAAPGMKFIHIVRHPGAVVASLKRGIEQNKMREADNVRAVASMSNAKNFPITQQDFIGATLAERTAYTWMIQNDKTHQEMQNSPNYMLVSYEDLCASLSERMSEICEFLGLSFDSQMKRFIHAIHNTDKESGYFSVMKNPLANIDKWELELDKEEAQGIANIIGDAEIGRFVLTRYSEVKQSLAGRRD